MIGDVHEPLEQYSAEFKTAHRNNTSDFFENLVQTSKVDEQANIETVRQLRALEKEAASANSSSSMWRLLRVASLVIAGLAALYLFFKYSWFWALLPAALCVPAVLYLQRRISESDAVLQRLKAACDEKRNEAWQQMADLNALFDWDIIAKLVSATVPRIEFDPYFSMGRLNQLQNIFNWSGELSHQHAIVFAHSGEMNGNPFVLARTLSHWMGNKTYQGSLHITWTEQVRDSEGRWRTETRSQTLHASIERPFPEYENQTFIVYGNDAAPDLRFTRTPSKLSKLEDGFFDKIRKNRAIKKLEDKARDLSEGNQFTVMSNREFDALFDATDRNHEVQFRLLFTPLAQQEMLKLLKDSQVGFGDDFSFEKRGKINIVEPAHMRVTDIDGDPRRFQFYELAEARSFFNGYHNDFFRSFYFGIAPLLSIPLYQQHRPDSDIYAQPGSRKPNAWEHEAIAYYHGQDAFKHAQCVTHSILKTALIDSTGDTQVVRVNASGYTSVQRTEYVVVRGGDGRNHQVPVHWLEYLPVDKATDMIVQEDASTSENTSESTNAPKGFSLPPEFQRRGVQAARTQLRRFIYSAVL